MSQASSTESEASRHADISPSKFDNDSIAVSGAHVVVSWHENNGDSSSTQHSSHSPYDHLTLQIHRDPSSDTAFFQLKTSIAFKARRDRTNVFVSIHPERIQTVTIVEHAESKDTAASKLGTAIYRLDFALHKPPALIVPPGDLTPKHKNSRLVMDSLQALIKQTKFSVALPTSTVSKARLVSLCESVSSGSLRSTPRFTDIASLYGGKGGRTIELSSQVAAASDLAPDSAGPEAEGPPSYDKLGISSPPRPVAYQSKTLCKANALRQRTLTKSAESGDKRRRVGTPDDPPFEKPHQCVDISIENVCSMLMERIEHGFSELGSRLDRMEHRLTGLERSVEHHAEKLGLSIEGIHQYSSAQADELRDELDRGLYDVRREIDDSVTVRVEDEMYVARHQLEDFVKEEVSNAEERLEERLEESLNSANVSLEFNWNR